MKLKLGCLIASAVLVLAGCSKMDMSHPMSLFGEGKEVKVSMNEVPAPVAATIESEAKGMQVGEIVKEEEKEKTVYEVKMGKEELTIDTMGKVIEREKIKEEKGEESEKCEKGEKGEMAKCPMCEKMGEKCEKCKMAMKGEKGEKEEMGEKGKMEKDEDKD